MNLLLEYINRCNKNKNLLSENISSGFKYHIEKGIPLSKNIFRPDSKQFFDLFFEARIYLKEGLYNADADEQYYLLETDIGKFDYYNGELVPLDWPIEYDYVLDEARKKRRKKRKSKSKTKKKSGSYYQGRKVTLNKPARGGSKKFYVYVRDPKTKNIKKEKSICKIMLIGPVNVGKSTLFNKIIDKERAIVTNIKGTTRDVLSNEFVFDGKMFEIFDTAGHRDKQGKIEKVGYKKAQQLSSEIDHFFILSENQSSKKQINSLKTDFGIKNNYTLVETKSDQYHYNSKNVKINHNLDRDSILSKLKISLIHKKYISSKVKKIDFNDEEIDFLENILQYKNDILNESDILIIAQIMRNILDDFSYEFGYINNEDVYDRVFSNFCIGK